MAEPKKPQDRKPKSEELQVEVSPELMALLTPAGALKASTRMRFLAQMEPLQSRVDADGQLGFDGTDLSVMEPLADLTDFVADYCTVSEEAKTKFERLDIEDVLTLAFGYLGDVTKSFSSAKN